jgi:hypothetical protein
MTIGYAVAKRGTGLVSSPAARVASVVPGAAVFVVGCLIAPDDGYVSALQWPLIVAGLSLMLVPLLLRQPALVETAAPGRALARVGVMSYTVLIVNEPLRSITHTMRAEGASTAWLTFWVIALFLPLTFVLARPLARVLGLLPPEQGPPTTIAELIPRAEPVPAQPEP